ncbi:MAG: hypothetical protein NT013_31255, partial [Planctomycetia bacterium]|nr:hypothetical protein [Planctomycetia bacterium]
QFNKAFGPEFLEVKALGRNYFLARRASEWSERTNMTRWCIVLAFFVTNLCKFTLSFLRSADVF